MASTQVVSQSPQASEIATARRELQEEAILSALPGLYFAGIILIFGVGMFRTPMQGALPGMALLLVAAVVWYLHRVHYLIAAWFLCAGSFLVVGMLATWSDIPAAISLLALPVGMVTLFVGPMAGIVAAAATSLLVLWAPAAVPVTDTAQHFVVLAQVWGTVWLVWLTSRSLLTAMMWFQSSYEQSRTLLEDARDRQLQLSRTLEDLAAANLQLSRLHRLASSMRQLAEEARRTKEQFVANVSHELRTPLNMIIGFIDMIMQAPQTYGRDIPQSLLADLEIVRRNSQHLSSLIDDVLDLSQIEAGQMALTKEPVRIHEVVDAAVIAVRPLYASKGLDLQVEVPADLASIYLECDPIRIRQVILNLLSNAGRFTQRGGVRVTAWQQGHYVVISVADTGPGIAHDEIERLFQPFQQVDSSIRRPHDGTGLGLSISKDFVELHGGKMWADSKMDVGTTFYFRLPLDIPLSESSSESRWWTPYTDYHERTRRSLAPVPTLQPRIVVLESGHALQRLVSRYLSNAEVVSTPTLETALEELSRVPSQVLLVNDTAVSERLPQIESAELPYGTPAIICSVPGIAESAGQLGVAGYLVKPVSRDELLHVLDHLPMTGNKVLLVDDDQDALRLFRRMLASSDCQYQVFRAGNGKQALRILRNERPDVVLLDLIMPEMDGFRFLAEKSQDPDLQQIPVIVLSAQDPAGQPIVCKSLAITRGGGISTRRLLASIEALTRVLAPQRTELRVEGVEEGAAPDGFADEGSRAQSGGQLFLWEDGGDNNRDVA